jgi:hypothetical protein
MPTPARAVHDTADPAELLDVPNPEAHPQLAEDYRQTERS